MVVNTDFVLRKMCRKGSFKDGTRRIKSKGTFPTCIPCCAVPGTHKEIKVVFLKHLKEHLKVLKHLKVLSYHEVCFLLSKEIILFYHHNNPKRLQGSSKEFG